MAQFKMQGVTMCLLLFSLCLLSRPSASDSLTVAGDLFLHYSSNKNCLTKQELLNLLTEEFGDDAKLHQDLLWDMWAFADVDASGCVSRSEYNRLIYALTK